MKRWLVLLLFLGCVLGSAQTIPPLVGTYFDLEAVAKINQGSFVFDGKRGILRFGKRIVYVFVGSAELIVDGQDVRLNAAVLLLEGRCVVPAVLLEALQLIAPKPVDTSSNLLAFELPYETLELKSGVDGMNLFFKSEWSSVEDASLFLMPFDGVAKLEPSLSGWVKRVVLNLNQIRAGQLLYFSLVSLPNSDPPSQLEFIQGATRYSVENGAGIISMDGVFPKNSLGVVKLPSSFDLSFPIRVVWGNVSADYVFR